MNITRARTRTKYTKILYNVYDKISMWKRMHLVVLTERWAVNFISTISNPILYNNKDLRSVVWFK